MSKRILFITITNLLAIFGYAQQKTYTLQEIMNSALQHNPLTKQRELTKDLGRENEKLLSAALFPELKLSEQNTFQSEVTSIDIPGVPKLKKDNYNIGLDFRFPLTDFDMLRTEKAIDQANTSLGIGKLDVELLHLRERVVNVYGNILLQKENKDILLIRRSDLEAQRKKVAAGVANGAVLKSNQLIFESEILTADQKLEDTNASITGLIRELSILSGLKLNENDNFMLPADNVSVKSVIRPETQLFKAQTNLLDLQASLLKKENQPKLFIYGQASYGRPGFDFLDVSLRPYGIIGVGISFNINSTLNQSRHLKVIDLNKQILVQQEENFNMNLQASLDPKKTEIGKYESIISKDEQILNNRKEIIRAANSQLENGVITSTEYLTELNAENAAQLNLTLHKVQLALAIAQYNTLSGY